MSRDLNAFVIQANDASYGDSRIFQPAKSIYKHVLRVSGGINSTALIGRVDLGGLKNFLKRPITVQMNDDFWKSKSP